jgi:hypothetical protein
MEVRAKPTNSNREDDTRSGQKFTQQLLFQILDFFG